MPDSTATASKGCERKEKSNAWEGNRCRTGADEAEARLKEKEFEIVLLDLNLPDGKGLPNIARISCDDAK